MLTSGLLIWKNTILWDPHNCGQYYLYGWPFKFYTVDQVTPDSYLDSAHLAFDVLFFIVVQCIVAWSSEWFIHKRILKTLDGH